MITKMNLKQKSFKKGLVFLTLLAVLVSLFIRAGYFLVRDDDLAALGADSDIVLLMGSLADRALYAAELAERHPSSTIYIVMLDVPGKKLLEARGVYLSNQAELAKEVLTELGIAPERVLLVEGQSQSTIDEALALREYFKAHSHKNQLAVVTSKYHSRRSGQIFARVLREYDVALAVYATPYDPFEPAGWFLRRDDAASVVTEYLKLLHFWLWERWQY